MLRRFTLEFWTPRTEKESPNKWGNAISSPAQSKKHGERRHSSPCSQSQRYSTRGFIQLVSYRMARKASKPTAFVLEIILNESRPVALAASRRLLLWCIHKPRREEGQLAAPNSVARVCASTHWHFASVKGFAPDLVLGLGVSPPPLLVLEGSSIPTNRFAFACEEL